MNDPAHTANMDQAHAGIRDIARCVGSYWVGLRAEGVDDYDATQLSMDLAARLMVPHMFHGPHLETGDT